MATVAACAIALSACQLTNEAPTSEEWSKAQAELMHAAGTSQIIVNMDPFNVAFRLNTLLTEVALQGAADVNDPMLSSIRSNLFGSGTTLSYDEAGIYTINYAGASAEYDNIREGNVVIDTQAGTLAEGKTWSISTPDVTSNGTILEDGSEGFSEGYDVSIQGVLTTIKTSVYTIQALTTEQNAWRANLANFESTNGSFTSDWSGEFTITQDLFPGDQSYTSTSTSTYTLDFASTDQVVTMYGPDVMRMTGSDIQFDPACPQFTIVGNGRMTTSFTGEGADMFDITTSIWSDENDNCESSYDANFLGSI